MNDKVLSFLADDSLFERAAGSMSVIVTPPDDSKIIPTPATWLEVIRVARTPEPSFWCVPCGASFAGGVALCQHHADKHADRPWLNVRAAQAYIYVKPRMATPVPGEQGGARGGE